MITNIVINDFIQNHWHTVLVTESKISIPFGNNIFILDKEGFSVHIMFRTNGKFDGKKYYYNDMDDNKLEMLTRIIPEFRRICMRLSRK